MTKKISANQEGGYIGEAAFSLWATKVGWFPDKFTHDHGLDFIVQVRGRKRGERSAEMPGHLLTVSVRSTGVDGQTISITRSDAELLFTTTDPMVFALVRRGLQGEMDQIAIRFPDEAFIGELDDFLQGGAEKHSLRFADAVTRLSEIEECANRLFEEPFAVYRARTWATLRLQCLLPEPKVDIVYTTNGPYGVVRSRAFEAPTEVAERPGIASAIKDIGLPFKALLPSHGHSSWVPSAAFGKDGGFQSGLEIGSSRSATGIDLGEYGAGQGKLAEGAASLLTGSLQEVLAAKIRQELAVWNYEKAVALAAPVEEVLASMRPSDWRVLPGLLVLLARVHTGQAESKGLDPTFHVEMAKAFLGKAEEVVAADQGQLGEISALKASVKGLEDGPEDALSLLEGGTDPYSVRARTALLLKQERIGEALGVLEGLEPDERWCDIAAGVYALNDQLNKAQAIVQWAAGLPDRSRFRQCIVRMADALMVRAFAGHPKGETLFPGGISPEEREKLNAVTLTIQPVLESIVLAGRPVSELDVYALRIAWNANHLLQRREKVSESTRLMSMWTPLPLEVAKGVINGYLVATPELPERLRRDHLDDFEVGILAGLLESVALGQHNTAFCGAKELVRLADNNEKKEELFQLFLQIWQNLEGADANECETIIGQLVAHAPALHQLFEAELLLRNGEADAARTVLENERAEDDIHWLQLWANALLQGGQVAEAVEFLLKAARKMPSPGLLRKTGDLAIQAENYAAAAWCYEQLVQIEPADSAVRENLAFLYVRGQEDLQKAIVHLRALHEAKPEDPTHTLNLAVCLARMLQPEESLALFDQLCWQESPPLQAVLGRAGLHHSLGHPEIAVASLRESRTRFWGEPRFLMAYMTASHAAGDDSSAHDALTALNELREKGTIDPASFRMVTQDEAVQILRQSHQETQGRGEKVHSEMVRGRMPWVWAEQVSSISTYWGWRIRTQEVAWLYDDPTNRARFCIYASNAFHPIETGEGHRVLSQLKCPEPGTKVVMDLSSLITLHRLDLLGEAADYFGEVIVPAGYLPTVLEDGRKMVLSQRSLRMVADEIERTVNAGRIVVHEEGAETKIPIVDEYKESVEHRYRIIDLVRPIYEAGGLSEAEFARILRLSPRPSAIGEAHGPLSHLQGLLLDLTTLETVTHLGLLEAVTGYYRVHVCAEAQREVTKRLREIACQEETREWHMDLWQRLRNDRRIHFVPHTVPQPLHSKDSHLDQYLPFMANFIAQEMKAPLMVDDRFCQALALNQSASEYAAFGTDVFVEALRAAGKLEPQRASRAIRQLMTWRYRFIVPKAGALKDLASEYRTNPPGLALREVAEYVHDCMRDPGLYAGPEPTVIGEPIAVRFYLAWVAVIAEFLVELWAEEEFEAEAAARLTQWAIRELLPSTPKVLDGRVRAAIGAQTSKSFIWHALIKASGHPGHPRLADAMKVMKEALRLGDDEYQELVTGILYRTDSGGVSS